jgi:hypothetical protein
VSPSVEPTAEDGGISPWWLLPVLVLGGLGGAWFMRRRAGRGAHEGSPPGF